MTPQQRPSDAWNIGEPYEQYVGRWSRLVAQEFLGWLDVPANSDWLDVGCGTGALSRTILDTAQPASLLGVDPSEEFVAYARERIADPHARFVIGDAREVPAADAAYDAVVAGLVINFVPAADQAAAVAEMRRCARPGGVVAGYVWDYAAGMQMMRIFWDAAVALDAAALDRDEGPRFPLCQPEPLAALFREAGLDNVETRALDVPTIFRDFDDYWTPFLGGQGPAPTYTMSLTEERRTALRERLRSLLPVSPDGTIHLTARAWGVRGQR